jgi:hypothetical protein
VLARAGCASRDDLRRAGYAGIARQAGVGTALLHEVGALIEEDWPPVNPAEAFWRDKERRLAWWNQGVSTHAATVLLRNKCTTIADVRKIDYGQFLRTPGAGYVALREIGQLIGEDWPLKWWIATSGRYRDADTSELIAELERRGYTVTARA